MALTDKLSAIGAAIREKTGGTELLTLDEMPQEIASITTGDVDSIIGGTITEVSTNLTTIRGYAFASCKQLTTARFPFATQIPAHCFNGDSNLTTVEMPNITKIDYVAFYGCTNLELTELPSGLTQIMETSFNNCKALKTLTFKSTPTYIGGDVFSGCTNLLTINVPWAEGEVAKAPWGATNATINYNYVGD